MSLFRQFPNQFAQAVVNTTSTGAAGAGSTSVLTNTLDFGYQMGLMKIIVNAVGPAYIQMNGQTATTNDYQLSTGDTLTDWYDIGCGLSGISIAATSTGMSLRIGAWG
jgi:hypothetical protein